MIIFTNFWTRIMTKTKKNFIILNLSNHHDNKVIWTDGNKNNFNKLLLVELLFFRLRNFLIFFITSTSMNFQLRIFLHYRSFFYIRIILIIYYSGSNNLLFLFCNFCNSNIISLVGSSNICFLSVSLLGLGLST